MQHIMLRLLSKWQRWPVLETRRKNTDSSRGLSAACWSLAWGTWAVGRRLRLARCDRTNRFYIKSTKFFVSFCRENLFHQGKEILAFRRRQGRSREGVPPDFCRQLARLWCRKCCPKETGAAVTCIRFLMGFCLCAKYRVDKEFSRRYGSFSSLEHCCVNIFELFSLKDIFLSLNDLKKWKNSRWPANRPFVVGPCQSMHISFVLIVLGNRWQRTISPHVSVANTLTSTKKTTLQCKRASCGLHFFRSTPGAPAAQSPEYIFLLWSRGQQIHSYLSPTLARLSGIHRSHQKPEWADISC